MATARIQNYKGEPTIMVNGEPMIPMTMVPNYASKTHNSEPTVRQFAHYRKAGMRVQFVSSYTTWNMPGRDWTDENGVAHHEPNGIEAFATSVETLLHEIPDAYIILRLHVDPPIDWIESHPEELIKYNDGSHRPVVLSAGGNNGDAVQATGMYSLCGEAFRSAAEKALVEYLDAFESMPFKDHIIGFSLCCAGTQEWYYPESNLITDMEQNIYGDFSEPFRAYFCEFLKKRYDGNVEKLRKAWNDPTATFENPKIPDMDERRYTVMNDGILSAMLEFESAGRKVGGFIEHDPKGENFLGVFLNANKCKHVADFFNAWHQGTADTIIRLAKAVKDRYPDMLVGSYYGALGCCDYYQFGTQEATLSVLDSGYVDFLGSAGSYNNREPGLYVAQREMQDSFRLRNEIYFIELDNRVHKVEPFYRDAMGLYGMEETRNTFKRDFGRVVCEDVQSWFFDFISSFAGNGKEDWMEPEGFYDLLGQLGDVAKYAISLERKKRNEIALIYDLESVHYVSQLTDAMFCDIYRSSDLGRIGAPVDYYFHNDMSRPDMPDYKLYIMINTFHLSDAEREAIKAKARKNHATVLWLYAPGFIDPDADTIMSNANIEATTGMKVGRIDATVSPWFKLTDKGASLMKYADSSKKYGYIDRDVHSTVWLGSIFPPPNFRPLPPAHMNPGFYIEDESAEVLGRYCMDGKAALAMKDDGGYVSVYCAAQFLRSEVLQSLAENAGVHLFVKTDDHICANENFVMIHAGYSGKHTIYFKNSCTPFEVFEKKVYAENVTEITVDMKYGETKMFSLHGEW